MEEFKNLEALYQQIKVQINNWTYEEKELPIQFKSQVTIIGDKNIEFHRFSAFASRTNGDSIIIPNQWFYLSKILLPYNEELHKYYDKITELGIFSSQRLDALKNGSLTLEEEATIDREITNTVDASRIKRFLTDYNWWHGAKSLGRVQKDYFVSAILSLSGLINDSSSFLATICDFLRLNPNLAELLQGTPSNSSINNAIEIDVIVESVLSTGLIYPPSLIKRLAFSLMAKPFVILSGLAGSGKTQLALAFAKCLSENVKEQVCTVSIGADWTNREPLLGYPNALKGDEYVMPESGVLQLLMRANDDLSKPYFLILDEMNLSVVERYFADFLSAMESGEKIKLWDNGNGDVPKEISLPKNVFIIGTINVDETTYMFSPKVLDRANVIEFKIAANDMDEYLGKKVNIDMKKAEKACADMAADFVNKAQSQVAKDDKQKDVLLLFFNELKKVNAEFGYRTVNEISRYLHFADGDLEDDTAIDTAILQKLLPKLHGSRKKLVPTLTALWNLCLNEGVTTKIDTETEKLDFREGFKYPESAEKIKRMYDAVIDNGFTSFAEA